MSSKEKTKLSLIKPGEKWFFPDFTNKLTWFVITLGASFILVPQQIKLFIINWLIEIFNINSGHKLTLPELEPGYDYTVGVILILFALLLNIGRRYSGLKKEESEHKVLKERSISDDKLLEKFTEEFPSNGSSCNLLREHDFGDSFNSESLEQIRNFYDKWAGAEYNYLDQEIEKKRKEFYEECNVFLSKISQYTTPVGASNFKSIIPDRYRADEWDLPDWIKHQIIELNELAANILKHHQEFILFAKNKLQS